MHNKNNNYSRAKKYSGARSQNTRPKRGPKKQFINPERFINHQTVELAVDEYVATAKFSDFGLNERILSNIAALGYEAPSAIQERTIPLAIEGRDVIGLANTGTGKTAAFLLPIINKLFVTRAPYSVLIIAPTRELAQQIDAEFKRFSSGMKLYSTLLVGGVNIAKQIRELMRRPHVIIGTPGRMKDLINRKQLYLYDVRHLVLDEADRMLDMGFINDIKQITAELPLDYQTLCFSATITPAVEKITHEIMKEPELISVKRTETNDHIFQDVVRFTDPDNKRELLINMLNEDEFEKVVVFGETKYGVQRLADMLTKQGIPAAAIHGNKSQSQRERALREFKMHKVNVLVATDVAARGLDIPDVSHVINYDAPGQYEDYVHRIGRTGRAGKTGKAYTFVEARR